MNTTTTQMNVAMDGGGVIGRRGFFRRIGLGAAGLSALGFTELMAARADDLRKGQMACIVLWMAGGPSQFETFDPKPDHPNGGESGTIETAVPAVRIAPGWEKTAAAMGDLALIRSMTNREGNHQRAAYHLHTGYIPTGTVKHPSFGANVAAELGDPSFDLPNFVTIGGPTLGAGLLGVAYEPFLVDNPNLPPRNVTPPVGRDRFERRMALRSGLDRLGFGALGGGDRVRDQEALYRKTGQMVLSSRMTAFDLDAEDSTLRDAYGRTPFGQGCLLARRLVESGVPFIEVRSNGWDTHQNAIERIGTLASSVDPALATLIGDLKGRGMLDRTLVVWMGEFGRTPRINPNAGRDHFPRAFNVALAGAGVRGGQVVGATSPDGTEVKDRPVAVVDLLATFCHALKINPARENMSPQGRPIKIVDGGQVVTDLFS